MSFSRVKPTGWAQYAVPTSTEFNNLDIDHANAVDGANGGSYSPSEDIEFPGSNSIEWGANRYPKLSDRRLTRVQPITSIFNVSNMPGDPADNQHPWGGRDWIFSEGNTGEGLVLESAVVSVETSDQPWVWFECTNLIEGARIREYGVWIKQKNAGGPSKPQYVPKVALYRISQPGSAGVHLCDTRNDYAASGSYHQVFHQIESAPGAVDELVDQDSEPPLRWALRVYGEAGALAQAGLQIHCVYLKFQVTDLRP